MKKFIAESFWIKKRIQRAEKVHCLKKKTPAATSHAHFFSQKSRLRHGSHAKKYIKNKNPRQKLKNINLINKRRSHRKTILNTNNKNTH